MDREFGSAIAAVVVSVGSQQLILTSGFPPHQTINAAIIIAALATAIFAVTIFNMAFGKTRQEQPRGLVKAMPCIPIATIAVVLLCGTSPAGPLIALLGIAALGGLWLLGRRHAPASVPHGSEG